MRMIDATFLDVIVLVVFLAGLVMGFGIGLSIRR